jgi:hypothetical protein
MNNVVKSVPVINREGKLAGYVTRNTTSIGASKLTGCNMQLENRLGTWSWVPAREHARE